MSLRRWTAPLLIGVGLAIAAPLVACMPAEETDAGEAFATSAGASLFNPGNRFQGWGGSNDTYLDEVQPLLGKRCVTCHGCSTSPCQLKLSSYDGVARGGTKTNVFHNTLLSQSPTRLKDAKTPEEWREKGFFSVTDGGKSSIMYRFLAAGQKENVEGFALENPFKIWKDNAETLNFTCVDKTSAIDERLAATGSGMPLGMPGLSTSEFDTLAKWLEDGAKGPSAEAQKLLDAARDPASVKAWEDFFNQPSPKAQLTARYLFEHLFFGKLHIDDSAAGKGDFFEIVRAKSQTGPIEEIVTEVPSDEVRGRFFYRLKKYTPLIVAKDHVVWNLSASVRNHWKEMFLDAPWTVDSLPGYGDKNPFVYFEKIPGVIRSQFMIENSGRMIDSMTKSDVCNGESATYAIRDRFFTLFLKPESDPSAKDPKLGRRDYDHISPRSSQASIISNGPFEKALMAKLKEQHPSGLTVEDLWDGGKNDKNAWVSVFRHGKSASTHLGPMGQFPETMWVMDYGNFERLFYDLVVLYRPWAHIRHKTETWRIMSEVRAHGEDMFLLFMPAAKREALRKSWTPGYAGAFDTVMDDAEFPAGTRELGETRPVEEFVARVREYLGPKIAGFDNLDPDPRAAEPAITNAPTNQTELEQALYTLTKKRGGYGNTLPDTTWVTFTDGSKSYDYTILVNRIYHSNSRIIGSALPSMARRPELDSLSVIRGHIGGFPELFMNVPMSEVSKMVGADIATPEWRARVRSRFEVKRNTAAFWSFLDAEHDKALKANPLGSGIIDTSEYGWGNALQPEEVDPLVSR